MVLIVPQDDVVAAAAAWASCRALFSRTRRFDRLGDAGSTTQSATASRSLENSALPDAHDMAVTLRQPLYCRPQPRLQQSPAEHYIARHALRADIARIRNSGHCMPDARRISGRSTATFEHDLCELLRIPSVSAESAASRRRRAEPPVGGRSIPRAGPDDRSRRNGRPSDRLRRVAAGARRADGAGLRPLRRAAARPAWRVAFRRRSSRRVRDGNVYARGATDDKGQMLTHIKSAEAWIKSLGRLPVQLKFVIEGEEEVGSAQSGPVSSPRIASGWLATWW